MNSYQRLWWQQARSDHACFELLCSEGVSQCHCLHYLQMATEKLAKAYFWSSGQPPRSHAAFRQFVKFLADQHHRPRDRERIAGIFAFRRFVDFQNWMRAVSPIVHALERLAPSLAGNGPNPEYPWPAGAPEFAPVNHDFAAWRLLTAPRGRELVQVIRIAMRRFDELAD